MEAQTEAKAACKGKGKRMHEESDSDKGQSSVEQLIRKKLLNNVEASLKQSQLKVFYEINVPFTPEQQDAVCKQFLHATISANLLFQWVEYPEVMTLFLLFQSMAGNVMPSHQQISGWLLNNANIALTDQLKKDLANQYVVLASDSWKDDSKISVTGVNITVGGKVSNLSNCRLWQSAYRYLQGISNWSNLSNVS